MFVAREASMAIKHLCKILNVVLQATMLTAIRDVMHDRHCLEEHSTMELATMEFDKVFGLLPTTHEF